MRNVVIQSLRGVGRSLERQFTFKTLFVIVLADYFDNKDALTFIFAEFLETSCFFSFFSRFHNAVFRGSSVFGRLIHETEKQ